MIVSPPDVAGQKARKRPKTSAERRRQIIAPRARSMVRWSNQLGAWPVETSTTCGPSGSVSRAAIASQITGEVKYWFSR